MIAFRDAIFGQDAGNTFRSYPTTYLRALLGDDDGLEPATWKHNDRGTGVPSLRRKNSHRRRGNVPSRLGSSSLERVWRLGDFDPFGSTRYAFHIGRALWPDRDLLKTRRGLPNAGDPSMILLLVVCWGARLSRRGLWLPRRDGTTYQTQCAKDECKQQRDFAHRQFLRRNETPSSCLAVYSMIVTRCLVPACDGVVSDLRYLAWISRALRWIQRVLLGAGTSTALRSYR